MQTPYPGIGRCIKVLSDTPHKWVTPTGLKWGGRRADPPDCSTSSDVDPTVRA